MSGWVVIPSPGQARPYARTPGAVKGELRSALRADPCRPGEPGVAHRVPDRGDDLTPRRAPRVHQRAAIGGRERALADKREQVQPETRNGVCPGQRTSKLLADLWSGAGSNRRPSAFQEALLIHVDPSLAAEQA